METQSNGAAPQTPDPLTLNGPVGIAVASVLLGWFGLGFVSVTLGSVQEQFRFYQLLPVIARPSRLFVGIDSSVAWLEVPFALLCVATIIAPFAARWTNKPWGRFGPMAPLLLIGIIGALFWYQASRETFTSPTDAGAVAKAFLNLANAIAKPAVAAATTHVTVGAGAWISLIGASYLAYQGARGLLRRS